jgi:hypothetical protein
MSGILIISGGSPVISLCSSQPQSSTGGNRCKRKRYHNVYNPAIDLILLKHINFPHNKTPNI